jgi:ribosomal protein S27E
MNPKQVVLAALGVICLALALLLFSQVVVEDKTTAVKKVDDNRCPNCGRMLPKSSGGECPFCKLLKGPEDPKKVAAQPRRWTTTDRLVVATVIFLTAGGGFLLWRSLKGKFRFRRGKPNLLIKCGHCRRGVRYFAHQAGKRVLCPGCMWTIDLPPLSRKNPSAVR